MDIDLSDEQKLLVKTAREFVKRYVPQTVVREMIEDNRGFTPEIWKEMASLGWLGWVIPEEYGGIGGSYLDLVILLEEMGRACMPGPFFSTVVLGVTTLLDAASKMQKKEILPKVAAGEAILTMALTEPGIVWNASGVTTRADSEGDNYVISGTKMFVTDAHVADWIIFVARTSESTIPEDGITLFLVDTKNSSISHRLLNTIGPDRQCKLEFDRVLVPKENVVGLFNKGWEVVERTLNRATVAKCAEMLGSAERVLELSAQYSKDRYQFGRPIGSFQAVQHRCADMAIDVDGMRLTTYQAAWMLSENVSCKKEVAVAKAWSSDALKRVVLSGLRVHGGVGFIEDHEISIHYSKALASEFIFGNTDSHSQIVIQELANGSINRLY